MSRLLQIVLFACVVLASSGYFGGILSIAAAERIEGIEFDPEGLTLIYTQVLGTYVAVEGSSDLRSWVFVSTLDRVTAEIEHTQTIRSSLSTEGAPRFFVRLVTSPGWIVRLAWDPVPNATVAGYRLYYRSADDEYNEAIDVGNMTEASVTLPDNTAIFYFAVTAYSTAGVESAPSPEIYVTNN